MHLRHPVDILKRHLAAELTMDSDYKTDFWECLPVGTSRTRTQHTEAPQVDILSECLMNDAMDTCMYVLHHSWDSWMMLSEWVSLRMSLTENVYLLHHSWVMSLMNDAKCQ